jgi:DNA-binding transcriptional MerR regulator
MLVQKYSIGAVSNMVGLPQSVLRYWESQFEILSPEKSAGGTRKYSDKDIATILKIKDFLYNRKFTIAGAQKELTDKQAVSLPGHQETIKFIITELQSIIKDLEEEF